MLSIWPFADSLSRSPASTAWTENLRLEEPALMVRTASATALHAVERHRPGAEDAAQHPAPVGSKPAEPI